MCKMAGTTARNMLISKFLINTIRLLVDEQTIESSFWLILKNRFGMFSRSRTMNTPKKIQDSFFLSFLNSNSLGNEMQRYLSIVTPTFIHMDICITTLKAYDNVAQEILDEFAKFLRPIVCGKSKNSVTTKARILNVDMSML